jgi:hypothetical protein
MMFHNYNNEFSMSITNPDLKSKFVDYLNEMLSAENAAIDRLQTRIQETPIQEAKQRFAATSARNKRTTR